MHTKYNEILDKKVSSVLSYSDYINFKNDYYCLLSNKYVLKENKTTVGDILKSFEEYRFKNEKELINNEKRFLHIIKSELDFKCLLAF